MMTLCAIVMTAGSYYTKHIQHAEDVRIEKRVILGGGGQQMAGKTMNKERVKF